MAEPKSWEYKFYRLPADHFSGVHAGDANEVAYDAVNPFGAEGWELVSVVSDVAAAAEFPLDPTKTGFILFFKRPVG